MHADGMHRSCLCERRMVVIADRFHDEFRQTPCVSKIGAGRSMGHPECFHLGVKEEHASVTGGSERHLVLLRKLNTQHDFADVVKKPRNRGLLRVRHALLLRQQFCRYGATEGVLPEPHRGLLHHLKDRYTEEQGPDNIQTEQHDGLIYRCDTDDKTIDGGIDDPQDLDGEGGIACYELAYRCGRGGWIFNGLQDLFHDLGDGRDGTCSFHSRPYCVDSEHQYSSSICARRALFIAAMRGSSSVLVNMALILATDSSLGISGTRLPTMRTSVTPRLSSSSLSSSVASIPAAMSVLPDSFMIGFASTAPGSTDSADILSMTDFRRTRLWALS